MRVAAALGLGVVGLLVGMVVNVLVARIPDKLPLRPLGLTLRPGSRRALVVQVACGLLWAAATVRFGADWALPAYLVFFTSLLAISVIDFDLHIIPNRLVYPTIFVSVPLLAVAAAADGDWGRLRQALVGAGLAWLALLIVHLISPAGMGFGDVRLAFVLGLFLGWLSLRHVLTGIFLGFLLGALIGVGLVLSKVRSRKDAVPFGPFLAGGAVLAVLAGNQIIRWWFGG
jgi:leader peptidase (prepilin peptidase) / N-methyltransferase